MLLLIEAGLCTGNHDGKREKEKKNTQYGSGKEQVHNLREYAGCLFLLLWGKGITRYQARAQGTLTPCSDVELS